MRNFTLALDDALQAQQSNTQMRSILLKVQQFTEEGKYSKHSRAKDIVATRNLPRESVAKRLGVTATTIKKLRSSISQELYRVFGADFFTIVSAEEADKVKERYLLAGGESEGEYLTNGRVRVPWGRVADLLFIESSSLAYNSGEKYNLQDCLNEVDFLKKWFKPAFNEDAEKVDYQKIGYLLSVLRGEEGFEDRLRVLAYMYGKGWFKNMPNGCERTEL